jgi:hypothetical protein
MTGRRLPATVWLSTCILAAGAGLGLAWSMHQTIPLDRAGGSAVSADLTLDEEQREFLWQIEHHGLTLNRYGFGALAEALRRNDAAALGKLFAADFTGQLPRAPREVRLDRSFAHVVRREDTGSRQVLQRDQFIAYLLNLRRSFQRPPQVQFALMALRPAARAEWDGAWEGTGLLRMWGEQEGKKPREVVLQLEYRIVRPTEENLGHGSWLHSVAVTQSQVAEAPRFLMREVARERGIDPYQFQDNWCQGRKQPNTGGVYLCDFDRDGFLDLLIVDTRRIALYKGLPGGRFTDVTEQVGLPLTPTHPLLAPVAAFVDLDGDGWEDLILESQVYRNDGGTRFVNVSTRTNFHLPQEAVGVAVADFDRDGRMDLYVSVAGHGLEMSWLDSQGGGHRGNQLWRNRGNWQFEDVTASSGTGAGNPSTVSAVWLDADNDGWPDLYVINEFGNGTLYVNHHDGTFRGKSLVEGPGDFGSLGVTCGDIDNDGNIDLYVANMYSKAGARIIGNLNRGTYPAEVLAHMKRFVTGSQLYHNRGGLQFEPRGRQFQVAAVGWAYGAALLDLDNDGWLDLYATCGFMSQSRDEPDG